MTGDKAITAADLVAAADLSRAQARLAALAAEVDDGGPVDREALVRAAREAAAEAAEVLLRAVLARLGV